MIPVLSRAQMRAFDKHAIETCRVPSIVLMENAGRGAADAISAMLDAQKNPAAMRSAFPMRQSRWGPKRPQTPGVFESTPHARAPGQPARYPIDARVVIVCGAGNNGGDGFVVARHLLARGADVHAFLAGSTEKMTGDARINHDAYVNLGGAVAALPSGAPLAPLEEALSRADVVVDALFGTGLDRPIQGHLVDVITAINRADVRCVALDIPSGLDADSGAPLGIAVQADDTITFGHLKIGLLTPEGARLAGNLHVVDIGVADAPILAHVGHVAEVVQREAVGAHLVPRAMDVYKHRAGDVLVIAGSAGKVGSSMLAARAAMRTGAGLVTIATWPDALPSLESRVVELMTTSIAPDRIEASLDAALARRSAVAIGPGLGLDARARAAVDHVAIGWEGVKVIDADAITHFAGRAEALAGAKGHNILTPHSGELGRLLGKTSQEIERDRFGAAREAVAKTRAVIVLKGARTIIATPDGRTFVNMAGNPALATAGSGDVLTGIVAALACAMPAVDAACAGVLVHALAGDRWVARTGSDRGMLAGELAEAVPSVLAALARGTDPLA